MRGHLNTYTSFPIEVLFALITKVAFFYIFCNYHYFINPKLNDFFSLFFSIASFLTGDRGDRGQQQQRGDQQGGQRSNGNPRGQDTRGPRPDRTPNQPQQQNGVPGKEF